MFDIRNFVEFNAKGRANCPVCTLDGKPRNMNLSVMENGAYKCFRGCAPQQIREALGAPKDRTIPPALAKPAAAPKSATISPQKVKEAHERLINSNGPAKQWLLNRGITEEMMTAYKLGVMHCRIGNARKWAIAIPISNADRTAYYIKKRVCPWDKSAQTLPDYQPWKQYGIPQQIYFTYSPDDANETWLCEGEWDAILLGWTVKQASLTIAVACFTCGAGNVPPDRELDRLPGCVVIWYDRNDKPLKDGGKPGEEGAKQVAERLGDRARIAQTPMPENCEIQGWDVSDALNHGYTLEDFQQAAKDAIAYSPPTTDNPLKHRLVWNDDLIKNAPDYTHFLVPDLITEDELFLLAAGPRTGKSLFAMTLAKSVAEGSPFLGRPCTQGAVIYAKCEDGDAKVKEREAAQGWGQGLPVAWLDQFKLSEVAYLDELTNELDVRLIVLDTLSRIKEAGVSESSAEMSQLLEPLQELAKRRGCCVLLVHHTAKVSAETANDIDIFDTIRGSSAIRAVCRGAMVLAAGDRDYRLVVENGWGKYDLKVLLDANTLTWKLLGHWNPTVNLPQQEQIIEALKKLGGASVEELHAETGIPKKSLYKQLSRLQVSEAADNKILKEGTRRCYKYRLALVDTIRQLNRGVNSENTWPHCVIGDSRQNLIFPSDQVSQSATVTGEGGGRADSDPPPLNTQRIVDYSASNLVEESNSPSRHPSRHYSPPSEISATGHPLNSVNDVTVTDPPRSTPSPLTNSAPPVQIALTPDPRSVSLEKGDRVRILTGRFSEMMVTVEGHTPDRRVAVRASTWAITREYDRADLYLVKRGGKGDE